MTDSFASLTSALSGRYTVERELGRGGYSVVYLAHDLKHDRKVALKVLQPELALAVRAERFLREIQIAAKLSHPHILPLYDSGDANGVVYYVMPYVEGESLRDRLTREKQLPLEDALAIARDVAGALSHAHAQGVVHRDIKPENILLHGGHAVVADFGIARALTVAGGQTVTEAGMAVGTPAYMSPEQGAGSGEPDGRSDIYSLGCVLYEMLAGHPPFTGSTAQEILSRHALDPVPALRAARPDVSESLERAVVKALAKVPVARFGAALAFTEALASPGAGVRSPRRALVSAVVVLLLLVGAAVASRILRPGAMTAEHSVAVLPFISLSTDLENQYFADGMTDELINALGHVEGLRVPPRSSSFALKGKNMTPAEAGQVLKVTHLVGGSVWRAGRQLRLNAHVVSVADAYQLWGETFEREITRIEDLVAVQEEVVRAIVNALEVKLATSGDTPRPPPTTDVEAHDLYLQGRFFWNQRTPAGLRKAIDYFGRAIDRDSGYALAHSGLSDAYAEAGFRGALEPEVAYPRAEAAALKALALDESLAEAHAALGKIRARYRGDLAGAEDEFQRAIALDPRYAFAHTWYGLFVLKLTGRLDDAIREASLGVELEPHVPAMHGMLGNILFHARKYDRAIEVLSRAIEMAPELAGPHELLGQTYTALGRYDEALAQLQLASGPGQDGMHLGHVGYVHARAGRRAEALRIIGQLTKQSTHSRDGWLAVAAVHTGLEQYDQALTALELAFADGDTGRVSDLTLDSMWDALRPNPRFNRLLKTLGVVR